MQNCGKSKGRCRSDDVPVGGRTILEWPSDLFRLKLNFWNYRFLQTFW